MATKAMARSTADIALIQETKLRGGEATMAARITAKKHDLMATFSDALLTAKGGLSGGCAAAVRRGYGLSEDSQPHISEDVSHRACHAWASALMKGGLHILSVYPLATPSAPTPKTWSCKVPTRAVDHRR